MGDQVEVIKGDIFQSRAQTLVNTVNCVGIMGKGLALEFKKRFPGMYQDYVKRCKKGQVRLGEPYLFRGLEALCRQLSHQGPLALSLSPG